MSGHDERSCGFNCRDLLPCDECDGYIGGKHGETCPRGLAERMSVAFDGGDRSSEATHTIMVGGFAPGNETPNNREVTIGTGAPVPGAGEANQGASRGAGPVARGAGDPDRHDPRVGREHRAGQSASDAALDPDGGPRAPVDAATTSRMVDDYTRVERLLVANGPPRSAGTTLAMAIEKLISEVRQEERQRRERDQTSWLPQDEEIAILCEENEKLRKVVVAARKLDKSLQISHWGYSGKESCSQEHEDLRNALDALDSSGEKTNG